MTVHCMMNVTMDSFACGILAVAGGQLDVLAHQMRQLGTTNSNIKEEHVKIEKCVNLHLVIDR